MSEPESPSSSPNQLQHEAATWFARMRGPDAEASRAAFEKWLARGALHRSAYNRAAEIFALGKLLAEEPAEVAPTRRRRHRVALAAVGALILLGAGGWLAIALAPTDLAQETQTARSDDEIHPQGGQLTTALGEIRTARLADSSAVILSGGTTLEVSLTRTERRLRLRSGQARFSVSREARPFIVSVGGGRVVVRGTVFDVELSLERQVRVRVIEGSVEVTPPPPAAVARGAAAARRLRTGETVSFAAQPQVSARRPAATDGSPEKGRAPADAVRVYDGVTVAQLIAEANQGSPRAIRLATPAVAERRLSGRFRIDDPALLAERLAILFDLAVGRGPSGEILLRPR